MDTEKSNYPHDNLEDRNVLKYLKQIQDKGEKRSTFSVSIGII